MKAGDRGGYSMTKADEQADEQYVLNRKEVLDDIDELLMEVSHSSNLVLAKGFIEAGNTHMGVMYLTMMLVNVENRMDMMNKIIVIIHKLDTN